MLRGKQRAYLRSLANTFEPLFQVGKSGLNENFFTSVSKALEAKDPYTCEHSERVAKYAAKIAGKLNWNPKRIKDIYNIKK